MLSNLHEKCIVDAAETGILHYFDELGLEAEIGWDFRQFADMLQSTYGWVNPTFNPDCRTIHANSFWVALRDARKDLVGIQGTAYFPESDLESLLRTGELFYDRNRRPDDFQHFGTIQPLSRRVEAPLSHGGATWTSPHWRGLYLAHYLTALSRTVVFRYLDVRWLTGCVLDELAGRTMPVAAYDYPPEGVDLAMQGYGPPAKKLVKLYALHMERSTALDHLATRLMPRPRTGRTIKDAQTPAAHQLP